ncbi:50S ribosomal protein L18 [Armatimonas sp.]|uniref:50S ribosomal protein L18 n=1 Tax=Armatimonas sp. TaxID=1872638 RepID=UPI00286B3A05|nr:50S ribosomal protein L18 [Armatimonas sp.]
MSLNRNATRLQRHTRIRKRMHGDAERPRLSIYRSLNHIYAQIVNDEEGRTLAAASSLDKDLRVAANGGNLEGAQAVGKLIAERAQAAGVTKVVFDRGGYLYHGRIKSLADAAREGGLEF